MEEFDFEPNAKVWIADTLEVFSQELDESLYEDGFDEGYDYYMKVMTVSHILGSYIRVEGGDLQKDFENLWILAGTIEHEQYARAAHIDIDKYEIDKLSAVKEWKPTTERMKQSFEYMKQLLNDIDVAINKNGKGETFGVSHQLGGDKVDEMESFMAQVEDELFTELNEEPTRD